MLKKSITKASSLAFLRRNWHVVVILAVTFVAAVFAAYVNRDLLNPDGISYLQIAQYYAGLHIGHAINGYWSPLISWLLAPAIGLGFDPLHAFRVLNVAIVMLIVSVFLYALNRDKQPSVKQKILQTVFVGSVGILAATWSGYPVTPDLLSAAVMLLAILYSARYLKQPSVRLAVVAGALFAAVYFAKSVGIYVGVAIIGLIVVSTWVRTRTVPRTHLVLIVAFLALVLPWIAAISVKYNTITVSTAGNYNLAKVGAQQPVEPVAVENATIPTHYDTDVSAWTDPSYLPISRWSVLHHLKFYANHLIDNSGRAITLLASITPLVIVGLFAVIKYRHDYLATLTILTAALVIVAYIALLVEQRHLWMISVPLLFCAIYYLRRNAQESAALLYISLAFLLLYVLPGYQTLINDLHKPARMYSSARILSLQAKEQAGIPEAARVAGLGFDGSFCFYTRTSCQGNYTITKDNAARVISGMRQNKLQYYVEFAAPRKMGLPIQYAIALSPERCHSEGLRRILGTCYPMSLTVYKL